MSDNLESSLINLGELSKPATVLIEKISDAVGGVFKPAQIVRVAKVIDDKARPHDETKGVPPSAEVKAEKETD